MNEALRYDQGDKHIWVYVTRKSKIINLKSSIVYRLSSIVYRPPIGAILMESNPTLTPGAKSRSTVPIWALAIGIATGISVALITIPTWVPVLGASIVGTDPKVFWYLSRASAFTAFVLIWVSMASGLFISNKLARIWPGAFTAFDLHQFTSLLGLGFAVSHALILLGDSFITYNLVQVLVPFGGTSYRPLWTGLGQIALYLSVLVTFTFYIRKQIGTRLWRVIHFLSYAMFAIALLHGIGSGTDSGNVWISWIYWYAGLSLVALTIYRVAVSKMSLAREKVLSNKPI